MTWIDRDPAINVEFCKSRTGKPYYIISKGEKRTFIPARLASDNIKDVCGLLHDQGIIVLPGKQTKELQNKLSWNHVSEPVDLVDQYGWFSGGFALPSGEAVVEPGAAPPEVAMPFLLGKCAVSGSVRQWQRQVAEPIAGQSLLQTLMLTAFASPLLDIYDRSLPTSFELFGATSANVQLASMLAASVCGNPVRNGGYSVDFSVAAEHPADTFACHADMPLILAGAEMFAASVTPKMMAASYAAVVCHAGRVASKGISSFTLITSGEPLVLTLGEGSLAEMARSHQVVLAVGPERPYGVFDTLPQGFRNAGDAAAALETAARSQHGTAMYAYLEKLVAARAKDEAELRSFILARIRTFRQAAKVDPNNQTELRTADAFGLLYAAGRLAREYGVLPRSWRVGPSVMRCYRNHRWHQIPSAPLVDRLYALAASDGVIDISPSENAAFAGEVQSAKMFVKHTARGVELMIRQNAIATVLPDYKTLLVKPATQAMMKREGSRWVTQRTIGDEGKVRVFCFLLPPKI